MPSFVNQGHALILLDACEGILNIRPDIMKRATDPQAANGLLAPVQYFCESSAMSFALFTIWLIASGIACLHAMTVAQIVEGEEWTQS